MSRYTESSELLQHAFDLLETRFADGHADALNSSSTSLHLDAGDPNLRRIRNGIHVYHGEEQQYQIKRISDLQIDDRAHSPHGHILLSSSVKKAYKALSNAIDHKMFRLQGNYDCANHYIRLEMTNAEFRKLPKIEADMLFPYYFKHSSLMKGIVNFSKVLPPSHMEHQRVIKVINVGTTGSLVNSISDGTVVYLGGNHDAQGVAGKTATGNQKQMETSTKYARYRYWNKYGPGGDDTSGIVIASPFPRTWSAIESGLNVALAELHNGHYLYWGTEFQPQPGLQLSKLPLEHVPASSFWLPEEADFWPFDSNVSLEKVIKSAWVLRGDRLLQVLNPEECPSGILQRLQGGFFRQREKEVVPWLHRIEARLKKAMSSIERYGAETFGFSGKPGGVVECDVVKLASYLALPSEILLAFIGQFLSSHKYFQGTVSFLLCEQPGGIFKITSPVSVGPWMHGLATDTGSGLLYVSSTAKYFSIKSIDGVSWLSEYKGDGIVEHSSTVLGQWIASIDQ